MIIDFLYCIDFPRKTDSLETSDKIIGWLLCSHNIIDIKIAESIENGFLLEYWNDRPDVALHFKDFPNNGKCGFAIVATKDPINLKTDIGLVIEIEDPADAHKNVAISLDLSTSTIQSVEVDDDEVMYNDAYKKTDEAFMTTLKKHPWLTIRMDITNKCNLRCIMCHYKEEEIYSQPVKAITADELKHKLQDIAPYVSHIMLSCGFEPLMSKHFHDILNMLHTNYPHIEVAFCTNAMLLNSKVRKSIIEKDVAQVLLSLDGVTKNTVEKIRVGANFNKIISNIMALRDLKRKHNRNSPQLFMDFVLMNSNIHEASAFVEFCSILGINMIDFRHLVGNIYFSEHDEMMGNNKAKYNYYRQLIIEASKKFNIDVRLPDPFETTSEYIPEALLPIVDLSEFNAISPDEQTENVINTPEPIRNNGHESDFAFLSGASCLRPFNEIMIIDQEKILPCAYYSTPMGYLDEENTLYSIFLNDKYKKVRQRKMHARFDHNCLNCPIKMNLLPEEVAR